MDITAKSGPSYKGHYFTDHPGTYGELTSSADLAGDAEALRTRMERDGGGREAEVGRGAVRRRVDGDHLVDVVENGLDDVVGEFVVHLRRRGYAF